MLWSSLEVAVGGLGRLTPRKVENPLTEESRVTRECGGFKLSLNRQFVQMIKAVCQAITAGEAAPYGGLQWVRAGTPRRKGRP